MNVLDLKMEGRSGCELIIEYQDNRAIIKKYSNSAQYNSRLIKQAEKQRDFYLYNTSASFSTPEILAINYEINDKAWFTMNYVFAEKYSDYLEQINVKQLKRLLHTFIKYLDVSFKNAQQKHVDEDIFLHKFSEVRFNIGQNYLIKTDYFFQVLNKLEISIPNTTLPIGTCHGDFTFSNILFDDQEIFLLDFLDSFIESPIIDIVKLRQDTCYKWSIMLEKQMPQYKVNKLTQVFDYFDKELELYCKQLGLQDWYIFLQAVNLLRIVPYLKIPSEILFIENALKKLLA